MIKIMLEDFVSSLKGFLIAVIGIGIAFFPAMMGDLYSSWFYAVYPALAFIIAISYWAYSAWERSYHG
jgi:hypothetical protein